MANWNFRFPGGKTLIRIDQIGRFQAFETGVGAFNLRDRMVDFLPTSSLEVAVLIVEMLEEVLSGNGRVKPDWSILDLEVGDKKNDGQQ